MNTSLSGDGNYLVTYKAVDKSNGDERLWNAWGPSEKAARAMIADVVSLHKTVEPFNEFHYVLTLSKDNVVIHTETDSQ